MIYYLLPLVIFLMVAGAMVRRRILRPDHVFGPLLVATVLMAVVVNYSTGIGITSVAINNGQITEKQRIHDSYVRSYSCNPTTVNGVTHFSTCTETRYTVEWLGETNIDGFTIVFDSKDTTSRWVYNSPDPENYQNAYVGQPVSTTHAYRNYLLASPGSIYHTDGVPVDYPVPAYPVVRNNHTVDRVIDMSGHLGTVTEQALQRTTDDFLRNLGPALQLNVIYIITDIPDPMYRHSVENKWMGGNKNDLVVFLGIAEDSALRWVDAMTWANNHGNEELVIDLRNALMAKAGTRLDDIAETVASTVADHAVKSYVRPSMELFNYLRENVRPNLLVTILMTIVGCLIILFAPAFLSRYR